MNLLVEFTLLSSVVLLVALALDRILAGRHGPALRHGVQLAALAATLALPALLLASLRIDVPVLGHPRVALVELPANHTVATPAPAAGAGAGPSISVAEPARTPVGMAVAMAVMLLWSGGALVVLARFVVELLRLHSVVGGGREVDERWRRALARIAGRVGVHRTLRLVETDDVAAPLTFGWLRPVVAVPPDARELPPEQVDAVLLHELAHVRRGDFAANVVARLAFALAWYNPLVHEVARRFSRLRERACDAHVLTCGAEGVDYAECLVRLARSRARVPSCALLMAQHGPDLDGRVREILAWHGRGGRARGLGVPVALGVAIVGAVLLTSLRPAPRALDSLPLVALHERLGDDDARARQAAVVALGERASRRSFEPLVAARNDVDPDVRAAVHWALARVGCEPAFVALVAGLDDPDPRVRGAAARGLATYRGRGLGPVPLERSFARRWQRSWRALVSAGIRAGDESACERLAAAADDPDEQVRAAVGEALVALGG